MGLLTTGKEKVELSALSPLARLLTSGSLVSSVTQRIAQQGVEPQAELQALFRPNIANSPAPFFTALMVYLTSTALICFAFFILWFSQSTGKALAFTPGFADAEIIIVMGFEQPPSQSDSSVTPTFCCNPTQINTDLWRQVLHQLRGPLLTLVVAKQVRRIHKQHQQLLSGLRYSV